MSTAHDIQELFTRARRIAFGTAASLVEILQDNDKRDSSFKKFTEDFNQLADEMAIKGEETEMEARRQVDSWWSSTTPIRPNNVPTKIEVIDITDDTNSSSASDAAEVKALTAEITALKAELERLKGSSEAGTSENGSAH